MKVFRLEWATYDMSQNYFFVGPDGSEEEFQALCDRLLPEAANQILAHNGIDPEFRNNPDYKNEKWTINWEGVIRELTVILPKHGYELIKLPQASYIGSMIKHGFSSGNENEERQLVILGDLVDKISDYNDCRMNESMNIKKYNLEKLLTAAEMSAEDEDEVATFLTGHQDLVDVIPNIALALRKEFGPEAKLVLDIPFKGENTLALKVRLPNYENENRNVMERIDRATEGLETKDLMITSDFRYAQ